MNIFDRARRMVAQCPHPTTVSEQLSKLAKRRRRIVKPAEEKPQPRRRYWWEEGE